MAAGLCACGGDDVAGDSGSSASSGAPTTGAPTTGTPTSTDSSPETSTDASSTQGGTATSTTTEDMSSGTFGSSGTGTTGTTGDDSSSSASASTGDETTGPGGVCGDDGPADPTAWSVGRGAPGENLGVYMVGAPPGAVVYATMLEVPIDLGGGPIDTGGADHVFVVSHATSGAFQWTEHVGGSPGESNITSFHAATDCEGNVVLGGQFHFQIGVQDGQLMATPGWELDEGMQFPTVDWFLMKFGPDGALLWARRFGDDRSQRLHGVDVQSDGTIIVIGANQGTLELGGPPIVAADVWPDAVLAAFGPDGAFKWQRTAVGPKTTYFGRLDVGLDDRISVLAASSGDTDLGGGVLPYTGIAPILAQFAADGAHRWSHRWQHSPHKPMFIGADAAGGAVVGGYTAPGDGTFPGFVLRHDGDGVFQWEHVFHTDPNTSDANDLNVVITSDEIAVLGRLVGTHDFGGGALGPGPGKDALFVARYDLAGAHLASAVFDATLDQNLTAGAYGPHGELVVGGSFQGSLDLGAGPMMAVGQVDLFVHRFAP